VRREETDFAENLADAEDLADLDEADASRPDDVEPVSRIAL
jgi:hypothetical protein